LFGDALIADDLTPSAANSVRESAAAAHSHGFSFRAPSRSGFGRATAKRSLPEGAGLTGDLRAYLTSMGFAPDQFDDIWVRFEDFARGRGLQASDWAAQFRTWVRNGISYARLAPRNSSGKAVPGQAAQISLRRNGESAENGSIESLRRVRDAMARFGSLTV
jgi:hypothetical protein